MGASIDRATVVGAAAVGTAVVGITVMRATGVRATLCDLRSMGLQWFVLELQEHRTVPHGSSDRDA